MENNLNQPIPSQPINPAVPPVAAPPIEEGPPIKKTKRPFDLRYLFIMLIIVGLVGGLVTVVKKQSTTPTPTPTDTPTPTLKTKPVIPLATQSAYLELKSSVASLSAFVNSMNISDTTLTPPTIELPLGFTND